MSKLWMIMMLMYDARKAKKRLHLTGVAVWPVGGRRPQGGAGSEGTIRYILTDTFRCESRVSQGASHWWCELIIKAVRLERR